VTETFSQKDGRYRIESVTEGIGVYALFGKRRLVSEGEVTAEGLRPLHFEQQQGNKASRTVKADFDWASGTLTMRYKGKTRTDKLEPGAQDILSFSYQFMYLAPLAKDVVLPVTTGKRLRVYHYQIAERDVPIAAEAGNYRTVHLVNAEGGDDEKQFWLGIEAHYVPIRISMKDENGAHIVQTLTSLHAQ